MLSQRWKEDRQRVMKPAPRRSRPRAGTSATSAALPCCLLLAAAIVAQPAAAQLGGTITLSSEARLRGRPISDHRPVAELQLVHDSGNGIYLGGSAAFVVTRHAGLQPLSFTPYLGFARRISPSTTLDIGIVHSRYGEYSGLSRDRG